MELSYLSPIFLREEKDNNHRLILNLKELNEFVPQHHFKMDALRSALNMTIKICFMASIDFTDAYYSVPIKNFLQIFSLFQFHRKFYKYTCLPNGLTSAPRIFTKIMKFVLSTLKNPLHPHHVKSCFKFFTLLSDSQCLKYNSQYAIIFC